jgi:uncharacterized membrane protein YhaH (DUF805 family)
MSYVEHISWMLFSLQGRLARLPYVMAFVAIVAVLFFATELDPELLDSITIQQKIICIVGFLLVMWMTVALFLKRLRDTGSSPWWLLVLLVPGIGNLMLIAYAIIPQDFYLPRAKPQPVTK